MKYFFAYSFLFIALVSCKQLDEKAVNKVNAHDHIEEFKVNSIKKTNQKNYQKILKENTEYVSDGFDFPVGKPNANGYYNAQKFQENDHLGDDWNGNGGGNSDLGDSIYAIGNGYISETKDYKGGWGNVVRIIHLFNGKLYESLYAHCDSIIVKSNRFIKKGGKIATIGNCNGMYYAHLHLEIRDSVNLEIGEGYSINTKGYLDPTDFITKNRK